jgi:hypothetical protein
MVSALSIGLLSCDDDDDTGITPVNEPNRLSVMDQNLNDNMITVQTVTVEEDSWIVVHADNGSNAPIVPDIISEPEWVEAGTSTDVMVSINEMANIMDGDQLWVMLHTDTGTIGEYEFDGQNGFDPPITDMDDMIVMEPITISVEDPTGMLNVSSQTLTQNMIMVESATVNQNGWIVVHRDNGNNGPVVPEIISVPKWIEAGENMDVMVQIAENENLEDGEQLWVMLHTDTGTMGEYEFDGSDDSPDLPITDMEGNIVMSSINVRSPYVEANDQPVMNNMITIETVYAAVDGWIVVHNDDGTGNIVLPDIIGKTPVTKGMNENVQIMIDENITYTPGQKLFPMLHIDEAPINEYNFPGVDVPEIFGNEEMNIIMTSINVQ